MRRLTLCAFGAACAVALAATVAPASAYLTGNAQVAGTVEVSLPPVVTATEEQVDGFTKHVSVSSAEGSAPAFVRVRAYAPGTVTLAYAGDAWRDGGDGWWYCDTLLDAGATTPELTITISGAPEDAADGATLNVTVVHEATPAQWEADGTPYADWALTYEVGGDE